MQNPEVELDLERRIQESRDWISSDLPDSIAGLQIRGFPCTAEPVMFLDDPKRKERHGVRFRLEIVSPRVTYESLVEIRVKPTPSLSKDSKSIANPPYIVAYAVNPETDQPDEITHEHLEIPESYKSTLHLSIKEWYACWIRLALRHKNVSKIFRDKRRAF